MYKVKDHADLLRDPHTGAILNSNSLDHAKYVKRREIKNKEHQKVQTIEEEVASMKDDINEIKSLLKELINGPK
jgi:hypothetical protein|tara:strand:- start:3062 stop:3283 length:222 start_codon:yes stop_codon:yes gene_type:complete